MARVLHIEDDPNNRRLVQKLLGAAGHDLIGFTATLVIFAIASLVMVPLGPAARRAAYSLLRRALRAS